MIESLLESLAYNTAIVVGKDVNLKIKIYWYFLNLDIALETRAKPHSKSIIGRKYSAKTKSSRRDEPRDQSPLYFVCDHSPRLCRHVGADDDASLTNRHRTCDGAPRNIFRHDAAA